MPEKLKLIEATTYSSKNVELARVGNYRTSTGPWKVTDVVVNEMVSNFDPIDPIPFNRNHDDNETNGKAQGQLTKVWGKKWVDDKGEKVFSLFGDVAKIPKGMKDALDNGEFFTRSVEAFRDPNSGWTLDKVAWLGNKRPAIKRMKPLGELIAAEDGSDFQPDRIWCGSDGTCYTEEVTISKSSKDDKEVDNMDASVKKLESDLAKTKADALESETQMKAQVAEAEKKAEAAIKVADEAKASSDLARKDARKAEAEKEFDTLIRAGKMTPAMKDAIFDTYVQCTGDEFAEIKVKATSGEGDKKKESEVSVKKSFDLFFASMPKVVEYVETTSHGSQDHELGTGEQPDGSDLNPKVDKLIAEGVDRDEAFDRVAVEAAAAGR